MIREFVQHVTQATKEGHAARKLDKRGQIASARPALQEYGRSDALASGLATPTYVNMVIDHPKFMAYVTKSLIEKSGRDATTGLDRQGQPASNSLDSNRSTTD